MEKESSNVVVLVVEERRRREGSKEERSQRRRTTLVTKTPIHLTILILRILMILMIDYLPTDEEVTMVE